MSVDLQKCELQLELFGEVQSDRFLLGQKVNIFDDPHRRSISKFAAKLCLESGSKYFYENAFAVTRT